MPSKGLAGLERPIEPWGYTSGLGDEFCLRDLSGLGDPINGAWEAVGPGGPVRPCRHSLGVWDPFGLGRALHGWFNLVLGSQPNPTADFRIEWTTALKDPEELFAEKK